MNEYEEILEALNLCRPAPISWLFFPSSSLFLIDPTVFSSPLSSFIKITSLVM